MDKICVSIFANDFNFCIEVVMKYEFVELRLDKGQLNNAQIGEIITAGKNIIATCRAGFIPDENRFDTLLSAINQGTEYIDIEHEFESGFKNKLIEAAKKKGCKIINSYHNYDVTPCFNELLKIAKSLENNCVIIKIACKVNSRDDLINLMTLYKEFEPWKLISLGLGDMGRISRVAAIFLGAPFSYASVKNGLETAEGLLEYENLKYILDGLEFGRL